MTRRRISEAERARREAQSRIDRRLPTVPDAGPVLVEIVTVPETPRRRRFPWLSLIPLMIGGNAE